MRLLGSGESSLVYYTLVFNQVTRLVNELSTNDNTQIKWDKLQAGIIYIGFSWRENLLLLAKQFLLSTNFLMCAAIKLSCLTSGLLSQKILLEICN